MDAGDGEAKDDVEMSGNQSEDLMTLTEAILNMSNKDPLVQAWVSEINKRNEEIRSLPAELEKAREEKRLGKLDVAHESPEVPKGAGGSEKRVRFDMASVEIIKLYTQGPLQKDE